MSLSGDVVNDVLQLEADDATHNFFRFAINTTIGVGGIFDPASSFGLDRHQVRFGETMAVYSVPEGAYVELPLLGPSTEREAWGRFVDFFTNAFSYALDGPSAIAATAVGYVDLLDDRYELGPAIDSVFYVSADSMRRRAAYIFRTSGSNARAGIWKNSWVISMTSLNSNNPSRRAVLGAAIGAMLALALPDRAVALTAPRAKKLVDDAVRDINTIISSGKSEQAMYRDFERVLVRYGDLPTITRGVLGADARRASTAELKAFSDAFQVYLARKSGARFRDLIGGRIIVQEARPLKSFYEVRTIADLKDYAPFEVTFMVSDRSGRDLFFDIVIEGISMLKTERSEIGAMLDRRRGDFNALAADLRRMG